jgi:hypothetical protein
MAADDPGWLEPAKELYRAAQTELLDRWSGPQPDDMEIFKEDLREALLDLKQAVIQGRGPDAQACMNEVTMLLIELRRRSQGG